MGQDAEAVLRHPETADHEAPGKDRPKADQEKQANWQLKGVPRVTLAKQPSRPARTGPIPAFGSVTMPNCISCYSSSP